MFGAPQSGQNNEIASNVAVTIHTNGMLDLNEVKDWVLEYPATARHSAPVFHEGRIRTADELERSVLTSGLVTEAAVSGTRQNGGFGPVPSRQIGDWWVDAFNRLDPQMNERQRRRLTAAYLLMAYTHDPSRRPGVGSSGWPVDRKSRHIRVGFSPSRNARAAM